MVSECAQIWNMSTKRRYLRFFLNLMVIKLIYKILSGANHSLRADLGSASHPSFSPSSSSSPSSSCLWQNPDPGSGFTSANLFPVPVPRPEPVRTVHAGVKPQSPDPFLFRSRADLTDPGHATSQLCGVLLGNSDAFTVARTVQN